MFDSDYDDQVSLRAIYFRQFVEFIYTRMGQKARRCKQSRGVIRICIRPNLYRASAVYGYVNVEKLAPAYRTTQNVSLEMG